MDPKDSLYSKTNSYNYGQTWLSDQNYVNFKQLGESAIKLHYLEKSLKSKRRLEQRTILKEVDDEVNEKYKYDKNAIVAKKFPFKAEEFRYPNEGNTKPKSLYIKYSEDYGKHKPNELELPDKFFPIDNKFTKGFPYMYKDSSLNCAPSKSKVHSAFDSIY